MVDVLMFTEVRDAHDKRHDDVPGEGCVTSARQDGLCDDSGAWLAGSDGAGALALGGFIQLAMLGFLAGSRLSLVAQAWR